MKLIKVNQNALESFGKLLNQSNELQAEQTRNAEWFDTPMKRMQWWMDLETQWKEAFSQSILHFAPNSNKMPSDQELQFLFDLERIYVTGNARKNNARVNNNPNIDFALTNLSGLRHLTNLKRIEADYNAHIQSLEPLSNLTNLEVLWFDNNSVNDLTPLMNLHKLSSLCFWNNEVTDLNPLMNMLSLTDVVISLYGHGNPIESFEPLLKNMNLKSVMVSFNDKDAIKSRRPDLAVYSYK